MSKILTKVVKFMAIVVVVVLSLYGFVFSTLSMLEIESLDRNQRTTQAIINRQMIEINNLKEEIEQLKEEKLIYFGIMYEYKI